MSFMDEWAQSKARAQEDVARTRLAGADPDGGGLPPGPLGPAGTLATDGSQKRNAAAYIEEHLLSDTGKAGRHSSSATRTARSNLQGWEIGSALKKAQDTWNDKVKLLTNALVRERDALAGTNHLFKQNEHGIEKSFGNEPYRPSPLLPDAPYPHTSPLLDLD